MAKNESSILEGLHFGSVSPKATAAETKEPAPKQAEAPKVVKKVVEKTEKAVKKAAKPAETAPEKPAKRPAPAAGSIQSSYAAKLKQKKETRSVRTTISLTPAVYEKLTAATEAGEIKSANDLINYLLEQYFA